MDWDTSDFDATLDSWAANVVAKKPEAERLAAEYIKGLSESKAPVETGELRADHEVKHSDGDGYEVYVAGPYARYQHYRLDLHHTNGQALYLEHAMVEGAPEAFKIMGEALQ